ncbi:MAG: hypothetical protein JWR85_4231 [Marmoricola sp.]|nr:hypothetical protein [Marmoricola sp.]
MISGNLNIELVLGDAPTFVVSNEAPGNLDIELAQVGAIMLAITLTPVSELPLELVPVIQQYLSGGSTSYQHTQSVASDSWTVNHNFGFRPSVAALSVGGREMFCEVLHLNTNQVFLSFDNPVAGIAICS